MITPPSARPPSSQRRSPDIDSDRARQFVDGATSHPSTQISSIGQGREVEPAPALGETVPKREQLRPLTLRIPEELHSALLYIADNGARSMNQFAIDALKPAADAQLAKITKRKALGLD